MAAVHFIFSPSAAGSLRQALKQARRNEAVHAFYDDLSFGPIAPPENDLRCAWVEKNLHVSGWEDVAEKSDEFWSELTSPKSGPVIWLSRRSSNEFAGFLACLKHIGAIEFDIIDLTDTKIAWIDRSGTERDKRFISGTGMLSAEEILRNNLMERRVRLTTEMRESYSKTWRTLQAENAPLRIVTSDSLVSAPITYFDEILLSYASKDWKKMAYIVGYGLAHWFDEDVHQVGDIVLGARIWTLIDEGRLEARGGMTSMHDTEVRLPS